MQKRGNPRIQIAIKGIPKDKDQIKCFDFQQDIVISWVSKKEVSIFVQLKRLITLEEIPEYKLKKRVIKVITINLL